MEKYINKYGKECYSGVDDETIFSKLQFHFVPELVDNIQYALHTNLGSLTVLNRITGFGWRDIETGYRDINGNFWLANNMFDIREAKVNTFMEAVDWVKKNATICSLSGSLLAQGDNIEDRWLSAIDENGKAYKESLVITTKSVTCPNCGYKFNNET